MEEPPQIAMNGEVEIKTVLHYGWDIHVHARVVEGGAGLLGSVEIWRYGILRCTLWTSEIFDTRLQAIAFLVAKADKWISLQASSGELA